jgi:hypothetical protein
MASPSETDLEIRIDLERQHAQVLGAVSLLANKVDTITDAIGRVDSRVVVLEHARIAALEEALKGREGSLSHWARYVVGVVVTIAVGAGGGILSHLIWH